jgi:hypothetical protein
MIDRAEEATRFNVFKDARPLLLVKSEIVDRGDVAKPASGLIGTLPEFDSLAVVGLIVALEATSISPAA